MNKKSIVIILVVIIVLLSVAGFFIIQKVNNDKLDYSLEQITENKYFTLKINDKYGVIDREGKIIVETTYDRVEIPNPSKDIFICYKDEKGIAINSNKQQMFSEYNSIQAIQLKNSSNNIPYEKSTLISEKNGKYGLIDFTGKKILETEFDEIEGFSNIEGQLQVKKNEKLGVVNIKGTTIVKTEYDNIIGDNYYNESNNYKEAGYIVGQKNENGYKYGYVNNKGELKLKLEYNDIYRITNIDYNQGIYLITSKNGQYGVMTNYANIINNEYQSIEYDNSNNVFIIQRNKKYGVADISGKIIIPVENTNIQSKGEYIYVERNNIKQVYDAKGNKIDLDFNKTIMPTSNENYKIVITSNENGNYYGVIGANDKQVIKSEYIYIEYAYNNYFIVCGQNGKLGVIDSNENTVIELNYDLVQKIQGKNMIQTLSSDTKNLEC